MRVLVTGGAGFIGGHITDMLHEHGHEAIVVDSLHPKAHGGGGDPACDLRDPQVAAAALHGIDAVCHQAAMVGMGVDFADAPDYVSNNDYATAVLLAAMAQAGIRRLVLASSMVVYGEGAYACAAHGPVRPLRRREEDLRAGRFEPRCPRCDRELSPDLVAEDALLEPRSVYAATKLAQEHFAAAWAASTGASAVALRYHNVYGPRMPRDTPYAGVAAIFRSALERGEAPRVFEDGGQRRDFIHVRDIARANLLALTADHPQGTLTPYNIASGDPHTIREMAEALSAAKSGLHPVMTGEFRAADVRHVTASPALAAAQLGFHAEVPFGAGITEFATAPLRDPGGEAGAEVDVLPVG